MHAVFRSALMSLVAGALAASAHAQVPVSVDRSGVLTTSRLELGVTHTQDSTDHRDARPAAAARGEAIITSAASWQNTHIIGWGPGNINPSPGVYDWRTLDARVAMMERLGLPMVITLCTAPGWMKNGGDTWDMEKAVAPAHYDDFAELSLKVAQRYPQVTHFQVWNEFKGFWKSSADNWDAAAYTTLYNKVYDKLKGYNPDLKVGGFYLVMSGTGADVAKPNKHQVQPITPGDEQVLDYWLANQHGADFISIDRPIRDGQDAATYTTAQLMDFTRYHGTLLQQVRAKTDLPIWYSEYYGVVSTELHPIAAAYASIYKNMVENGADVSLLWNPNQANPNIPHGLFSDVRNSDGGMLTPHGQVFQWISQYFENGTPIHATVTGSPDIEALASLEHTMLINKSGLLQDIVIGGQLLELQPYEVRLLDAAGAWIDSTRIVVPEPALLGAVGVMLLLGRRRGKRMMQ